MLIPIHAQITTTALKDSFRHDILKVIIRANQHQDGLFGQVGHDEFHYDNNQIIRSNEYLEKQRALVLADVQRNEFPGAWRAFGRLLHAAQDLYAHSNYVKLWLVKFPENQIPTPIEIDPLDKLIMLDPGLKSGRLYYPLELFSFIPRLNQIVISRLPKDSHAWMNLDHPERGPLFQFAFSAAVKRSRQELELIRILLDRDSFQGFTGR